MYNSLINERRKDTYFPILVFSPVIPIIPNHKSVPVKVPLVLHHKVGQDERWESFIGKFRYALTMLPGKNNAR